jgi:uncharacterized protein (TIGR00297 family)
MLMMAGHLPGLAGFQPGLLLTRAFPAALVTLVFALAARLLRGVSRSGAIAGAAVSFILYLCVGPGAFVVLISVFLLATVATRFGYAGKRAHGTAEKSGGRTASQVLANLGVAAVAAVFFGVWHHPVVLIAMSAALAEAAADTVSSECGQALREKARLITTWQTVPAGTDGGITLAGTLAGVAAAFVVCAVCVSVGLISPNAALLVWISGVLGMVFDSVLGASLERRRVLNNDTVNFLSTVAAALLVVVLCRIFF